MSTKTITIDFPANIDPFLFQRARAFLNVAERTKGYHEDDVKAVLQAFACELFLKGLAGTAAQNVDFEVIETEGGVRQTQIIEVQPTYLAWGHDLKELFDKLDASEQERLVNAYLVETEGQVLCDDLEHCATVFKDARYSHEGGKAHSTETLARLTYFLQKYCLE